MGARSLRLSMRLRMLLSYGPYYYYGKTPEPTRTTWTTWKNAETLEKRRNFFAENFWENAHFGIRPWRGAGTSTLDVSGLYFGLICDH